MGLIYNDAGPARTSNKKVINNRTNRKPPKKPTENLRKVYFLIIKASIMQNIIISNG